MCVCVCVQERERERERVREREREREREMIEKCGSVDIFLLLGTKMSTEAREEAKGDIHQEETCVCTFSAGKGSGKCS